MNRLVILLIMCCFLLGACSPYSRLIKVHGSILTETGKPIPEAKVLVCLTSTGWIDRSSFGIGTKTNEKGEFAIDYTSPFSLSKIDLEVITNKNSLALFGDIPKIINKKIILYKELELKQAEAAFGEEYDTFDGVYCTLNRWITSEFEEKKGFVLWDKRGVILNKTKKKDRFTKYLMIGKLTVQIISSNGFFRKEGINVLSFKAKNIGADGILIDSPKIDEIPGNLIDKDLFIFRDFARKINKVFLRNIYIANKDPLKS